MKELLYTLLTFFVLALHSCDPSPGPIPTPTPGGGMAYRDVVLATRPSDMIAYLEMNGNLADSSPNGLTGAVGTDVTYSLIGVDGTQSALFNGTTSYIDLGANFRAAVDAADMSAGTVVLWLKPATDGQWSDSNRRQALYIYDDGLSFLSIGSLGLGDLFGGASAGTVSGYLTGQGSTGVAGTAWRMVAISYHDSIADIYVDGVYITTAESGTADDWSSVYDAVIGGYPIYLWAGYIDEFTIWGAALTAEEITTIYNAGFPGYTAAPPPVGTNAVVQIFDRTGVPIGEVLPAIDYVSWRRNEIGQAVFYLAKSDPKVNDTFLRAQNRVLVTFDNGLPPWGGIMQPEFTIDHSRIRVRALTAESLLSKRLTDRGRYFNQQTVGNIASALINEANAVLPLGIELGTVWAGGTRHSPEYHYKDLLTIFRDSLFKRLSDADFYTEPVVQSDGRLIFRLHVMERRGRDVPGVALHQGLNVVEPTRLAYSGPIVNRWVIVGDGDGWGNDRPVAVAEDMDSIARYGRLEASEVHQGVVYQETLQETADILLAETAWPRIILDLTAVDLPPATFEQYDIGDNLPVELPDYGIGSSFIGAATVTARAFYPNDGRLNLVLEATAAA